MIDDPFRQNLRSASVLRNPLKFVKNRIDPRYPFKSFHHRRYVVIPAFVFQLQNAHHVLDVEK